MNNKRFCIVGLGLLGGSYAMALTKAGFTVTAVDINHESIEYALSHGIIKEGSAQNGTELIKAADVIVLCVYPHTVLPWVRENAQFLKEGAILTDVTGVKGDMPNAVQKLVAKGVHFIACHPMAGREVGGVQNANDEMFKNANFIITPTKQNDENDILFAKNLGKTLGFSHIAVLSPNEHDKMIGYVSQLTHAIAVSLMNASDCTHLAEYTGDSFRDLTRIARINEDMWCELFLQNSAILSSEIDSFCLAMQNLKACLEAGDAEGLKKLFVTSTLRRAAFDK